MTNAKVSDYTEIAKLKEIKSTNAKECSIENCKNIGVWCIKRNNFYLLKGLCLSHYKRLIKYGNPLKTSFIIDGRTNHPLYSTWKQMVRRCTNPNDSCYKNYGAKGIEVCSEWENDFFKFVEDMGEKPVGDYSLERVRNDKGYFKENCEWATRHKQNSNRNNSNEIVGVSLNSRGTWTAQLAINKIMVLNKRFKTKEDAIKARKDAEIAFNIK